MVQSFSGASISTENKIGAQDEIPNLTGYYKGISDGDDTLRISITVFSGGKTTGYGSLDLMNGDDKWRCFNLPIKLLSKGQPETFRVSISVNTAKGSHNMTKYSIDDLKFSE
jgi:hypothetical protein